MIMRTKSTDESTDYRILDGDGRLLGRVQAPEGPPSLGPGAGTVLLLRECPLRAGSPPAERQRAPPPRSPFRIERPRPKR